MRKGISFYYGFKNDPELRAKKIKEAGFDCVITNADKRFNKQNGSIAKQMKLFKKYGLGVSSLHMTYTASELPYFWQGGRLGEKLKKSLIRDVKIAHKYGFSCVVVHTAGEYSKIGEKRFLDVLKVCEKVKVPLALENLDSNRDLLVEIFKNIKSDYLKFCYDCGHNNVFDKKVDYLKVYSGKVVALHLHDNDGKKDLHTISKVVSTVDWDKIADRLKDHKELSLDLELLNRKENSFTADEYLQEAYKQVCDLEKKILEPKKSTSNTKKAKKSVSTKIQTKKVNSVKKTTKLK